MSGARVPLSVGFPPIADANARVLVLGSLPGVKSLEMREYYAQPYNAFWRIMGELTGAGPALEYPARLVLLRAGDPQQAGNKMQTRELRFPCGHDQPIDTCLPQVHCPPYSGRNVPECPV